MNKDKLKQKIEDAKAKEKAKITVIGNNPEKVADNQKEIHKISVEKAKEEQRELARMVTDEDRVTSMFMRAKTKHSKNDDLVEQVKKEGYGGKTDLTQGQASGISYRMQKQGFNKEHEYEVTTGKGDDGDLGSSSLFYVGIRKKQKKA